MLVRRQDCRRDDVYDGAAFAGQVGDLRRLVTHVAQAHVVVGDRGSLGEKVPGGDEVRERRERAGSAREPRCDDVRLLGRSQRLEAPVERDMRDGTVGVRAGYVCGKRHVTLEAGQHVALDDPTRRLKCIGEQSNTCCERLGLLTMSIAGEKGSHRTSSGCVCVRTPQLRPARAHEDRRGPTRFADFEPVKGHAFEVLVVALQGLRGQAVSKRPIGPARDDDRRLVHKSPRPESCARSFLEQLVLGRDAETSEKVVEKVPAQSGPGGGLTPRAGEHEPSAESDPCQRSAVAIRFGRGVAFDWWGRTDSSGWSERSTRARATGRDGRRFSRASAKRRGRLRCISPSTTSRTTPPS